MVGGELTLVLITAELLVELMSVVVVETLARLVMKPKAVGVMVIYTFVDQLR